MRQTAKDLIKILIVAALVIPIISVFAAWQEPGQSPPGGNVPAPLNVSSTAQIKEGGLWLNTGGASTGLIVDKGKVGIGTVEPAQKLDVSGNVQFSGALMPSGSPGSSGQVLTSQGAGVPPVWQAAGGSVPPGFIGMYSGPWNFDATGLGTGPLTGWALCNGQNGTPDLTDKFVMGTATSGGLGATGGSATHSHGVGTNSEVFFGPQSGYMNYIDDDGGKRVSIDPPNHHHLWIAISRSRNSNFHYSHEGTYNKLAIYLQLDPDFTTNASSNTPPYFKLAFIMKL